MLLGLTLMVTNIQGIFEWFITYLLLFWEQRSLLQILKKNLRAHKQRNRLTSIIYALSLGSIIFLLVAADLQIQVINLTTNFYNADIVLRNNI